MKRKLAVTWAALSILLASSCQPALTPTPIPMVSPAVSPSATLWARAGEGVKQGAGVVLITLDGARPDWIARYMQNGTMPNLAALAQRGVMAAYMQTVDPALAATAYLSLSTGTFPNRTGWVSDRYHMPQQAFHQYADPLAQLPTLPEPIWRTAMRHGLKTATVFWPSALLDVPDLHADYMVTTVESDIPAAQHVISFEEANAWVGPPPSFSPLREGTLRIVSRENNTAAVFNVLAVDSQDDGTSNYDLLILDDDKVLTNGHTELHLGKWTAATISPRLHSGAYFCLTASTSVTATVYQSRVGYNQARPTDLLRAVNDKFGFPPPALDADALRTGWLSAQQYCDLAELRAKWMMDVVLYVYQTYQPALLLTAQNIIAECARSFLLVDERQKEYTPEKAELYASYLQKAHTIADKNLGRLLALVNLADSAVFILSAHGTMPVHTTVHLNTILSNARLLQLKTSHGQNEVDDSKSKALAFASGGSAHIYINLQGREWPGLVAPDDYAKVQQQIIQALEETKGEDGQPVFTRMLKREELDTMHLASSNSGDVFVQAAPGYCLSDELGFKKVLAPSPCCAEEGFAATFPEMNAIFVAAGNNLVSGGVIPAVHITDIAPTVAKALGFQPSATINGHAVEGIWR